MTKAATKLVKPANLVSSGNLSLPLPWVLTDRCFDLNEGDVRFLVHVFDFGVVGAAALQLHFHPVLVGHDVGIGHNQAVLWHDEARTAGHRHLPLGISHPVGGSRGWFIFTSHFQGPFSEKNRLNTWCNSGVRLESWMRAKLKAWVCVNRSCQQEVDIKKTVGRWVFRGELGRLSKHINSNGGNQTDASALIYSTTSTGGGKLLSQPEATGKTRYGCEWGEDGRSARKENQ